MVMLPLSDVKARLSEIAEEVDRTHERVHITRNGREYVVLIAAEDLESIEATLELLADPAAQQRITQSQQEIARGEGMTLDQVEQAVADAGSCWLWVSKPISQRWACGVRRTRQAYRRSKLAPFLRRSSSYLDALPIQAEITDRVHR